MNLLVHISDVHLGMRRDPKPAESVVAAVRGLVIDPSSICLVLSGDIANTGKAEEYKSARKYFCELRDKLEQEFNCPCHVLACPGNHDCNFPPDLAMRDLAIKQVLEDFSHSQSPKSESILNACLAVQDDFNKWANDIEGMSERGLVWLREIKSPDRATLTFQVLNSAWMSTIKEKQGTLFFPIFALRHISTSDVRITIMHHPYSWFESTNGRELRRALEVGSDIILTGHEHDVDRYATVRESTVRTGYIEGGAFNGVDGEAPCFNVIQIDSVKSQYAVTTFKWQHTAFRPTETSPHWESYKCLSRQGAREQMLSPETQKYLKDPGLDLTHRAKTITLEDIFVAPDLRTYTHCDTADSLSTAGIPSRDTLSRLMDDRYAYLLGEEQCGKTALSKTLFTHAVRQGLTPVLLVDIHNISADNGKLKRAIDSAVRQHYDGLLSEDFWTIEVSKRVAIVDGFSETKLNPQGKAIVADWLRTHFGRVYLFGGDDMTQLESLLATPGDEGGMKGFKRYEIRPFGHELRYELITKWSRLGRELVAPEEELHYQVRAAESLINSILGDNLFPAYPMHILLILQQMESNVPHTTGYGSYGYFYEEVFTIALQRTSDSPEDLDAKYTYLSELAWHMFRDGHFALDLESLTKFSRQHCKGFQLPKSHERFQEEIIRSHVIQPHYGKYGFIYKYFLYYFVARYLRDNIDDAESKEVIQKAVKDLHREDYANILIFYTYLTKSKPVIESILETTRSLFQGIEPCNLEAHVKFISRIQNSIPEVVLHEAAPEDEKRALLHKMDQGEHEKDVKRPDKTTEPTSEENIASLLSINRAIKALQVLGQILRNFSGSLKSDLKRDITRECFDVGLRFLNSFYQSMERQLSVSFGEFADLFALDLTALPERKRVEAANHLVFMLTEIMCLTTLRRISNSVGSDKLIQTYQYLEGTYNTRATRFIQLSLRLDHCRHFPEELVTKLFEEVKNDSFGLTLLRVIVAEHFHFFPRPYTTRQRVCEQLGISFKKTVIERLQFSREK